MADDRKTDNLTMRIWLELIENIAGMNGLKSILNYAHLEKYIGNYPPENDEIEVPVEDIKTLYRSLMELFGQKGARGLQLRAGREFVRVGQRKRPDISKRLGAALQSAPESERVKIILELYIKQHEQRWTSKLGVPRYELQDKGDYILMIDRDNPMSENLKSQAPVCSTIVGFLQEMLKGLPGNPLDVEEIECRAMGHPADVFRVSRVTKEE
ncbi:MAG: hypothetical protein HXS44_08870 [Theionarchaea archaeon]|nr:hypothetical protein [Theionarchaea archaeon]